jgi:lactoylglutathione lyase
MSSAEPRHEGLYEVHLPVTDLPRSIEFYGKLGFGVGFAHRQGPGALLMYERGGKRWMLGLFRVTEVTHRHPAESHFALRMSEEDVDEMIPYLARLGIVAVHPDTAPREGPMKEPIVHGWMPAASVFFRDPDGHLIELIAELSEPPRPDAAYMPLSEWRGGGSG